MTISTDDITCAILIFIGGFSLGSMLGYLKGIRNAMDRITDKVGESDNASVSLSLARLLQVIRGETNDPM